MKKVWRILWRFGRIYFFYPAMIALALWLYYHDYHWIFGVGVIVAIFVLDPIWARMVRNSIRMWKRRKR